MADPSQPITTMPNVQWQVDNLHEIMSLLSGHMATIEQSGDACRIRGPMGLEIVLQPGDCLVRDGDRLGVVRVPDDKRIRPKLQTIEVRCENCDKPIQADIDILQDPTSVWVVCSDECQQAYEFKLILLGQLSPFDTEH